jgi:hypothetical protein
MLVVAEGRTRGLEKRGVALCSAAVHVLQYYLSTWGHLFLLLSSHILRVVERLEAWTAFCALLVRMS